jgi:hypothetical protein
MSSVASHVSLVSPKSSASIQDLPLFGSLHNSLPVLCCSFFCSLYFRPYQPFLIFLEYDILFPISESSYMLFLLPGTAFQLLFIWFTPFYFSILPQKLFSLRSFLTYSSLVETTLIICSPSSLQSPFFVTPIYD